MSQPLPHILYKPKEDGAAPHALIVFLHGSGERGDGTDLDKVKIFGVPAYLESGNTLPAYVLAPQCPLNVGWHEVIARLDRTIDDVIAMHPIDQRRITITGFSMGGYGAWAYVTRNQSRFAAMLPVAGTALSHELFLPKINPCDIRQTPVWIIQSEGDGIVPANRSDQVVTILIECDATFTYTRYDTEDHGDAARRAYADPAVYEWLLQQVKS